MNYFDVLFSKKLSGSSNIKIETLDVVANGTYFAPAGSAYGTVNVDVPSSSVEVEEKDVNFWDYDGTLVASYTKSEFATLSAMPDNPAHQGLTAQGWNWSLADAKDYVTDVGMLDIGQQYITSDGKTRLYVEMMQGRLNPELNLTFTQAGSFTVDWGDGATPDTVSGAANTVGTIAHTYARAGNYVVTITVDSGAVAIASPNGSQFATIFKKPVYTNFNENYVYNDCIKKVEFGSNIALGIYAFKSCESLNTVTMPRNIGLSNSCFTDCNSLGFLTVPDGAISINQYALQNCYSLHKLSVSNTVASVGNYAMQNCLSLRRFCFPKTMTVMVGNGVNGCKGLVVINFPGLVTCGAGNFGNCYSLASITFPESTASISYAFGACWGLHILKFEGLTPPTAVASTTFTGVPEDCIIYVPAGTLEDYEDATNYPDPDVYQYVEY